VEECESAEEFLLEPWVLLQLPFEPTILHQWTVALMAEALRFRKKITDFTTMAYPEHLKSAVDKLVAIDTLLQNGANSCMSYVAQLTLSVAAKKESIQRIHFFAEFCWEDFQRFLPQLLSALKFVLSEECDAIISRLKRMAWGANAAERTCMSKAEFLIAPSFYSHDYWDTHYLRNWFFSDRDMFEVKVPTRLMIKYERVAKKEGDTLKKLIKEKILITGRLQGESEQVIFESAENNADALEVFNTQYQHYKGK
jgi:hypothetical protein